MDHKGYRYWMDDYKSSGHSEELGTREVHSLEPRLFSVPQTLSLAESEQRATAKIAWPSSTIAYYCKRKQNP
ncbi:hypothetical protein Sjap_005468 [Stephania japonica]|uniref:Uncharacterized protein n=1 Tax=Stephania japonica TaxID=461633 RepID=A0AAP0K580_9MAGN